MLAGVGLAALGLAAGCTGPEAWPRPVRFEVGRGPGGAPAAILAYATVPGLRGSTAVTPASAASEARVEAPGPETLVGALVVWSADGRGGSAIAGALRGPLADLVAAVAEPARPLGSEPVAALLTRLNVTLAVLTREAVEAGAAAELARAGGAFLGVTSLHLAPGASRELRLGARAPATLAAALADREERLAVGTAADAMRVSHRVRIG